MNTKNEGRKPIYENSLKIAIAREYLTGTSSYRELAFKYGFSSLDTIRHFVRWYKESQKEQPLLDPGLDLAQNTKEQGKQLEQANLRIAGLEMLIEIAGKELGIDIVKKLGAKQSKK